MNLKKYDDKYVQIIDVRDITYEGICRYDDKEYCYHEYGRNEDCLNIMNFLFFKSDIKKVKVLKDNKFTEPFGEIERIIVEDGISSIEDAFECEEDEHIYRVLLCLETKEINEDMIKLLKKLIKYNTNEKVIKKAKEIMEKENL